MKNGMNSGTGLAIGLSIGTAIGVATSNIGLWLPVGMCLGLAVGTALGKGNDSDNPVREQKQTSATFSSSDENKMPYSITGKHL